MFALMLVPLVAMMGVATEASGWFVGQRAIQHTADQAALAAAMNGCLPSATCAGVGRTYSQEAAAVAAKYNLVNGVNDTAVAASTITAPAPCSAAPNNCYVVTIQHRMPFRLLSLAGFTGNTTTGAGAPAQMITATARAARLNTTTEFCITATNTSTQAFRVNGGAQLSLTGCPIYTPNGGATCNGQFPPMESFVAVPGSNQNCGLEIVNPLNLQDPYAALATSNNLPSAVNSCGGNYPQRNKTGQNKDLVSYAPNKLSGSLSFSSATPKCGDLQLTNDVTVTGNSTLVVVNGRLDLAGHNLRVAANAALTIVFTGTNSNQYDHTIVTTVNSGVLDFSAPNSGSWSGVAVYQDPLLTQNVDMTVSGNSPQFDITGLIYTPHATITLSGAINHATAGLACLAFFADQLQVNGTAAIFANPTIQCPQAGLSPTQVQTLQKAVLVG